MRFGVRCRVSAALGGFEDIGNHHEADRQPLEAASSSDEIKTTGIVLRA